MPSYSGPIIDPHHHLWDLTLKRHPWLGKSAGDRGGLGDLAPIKRSYLPDDYRRDAVHHNVVATVHIEANWLDTDCVGETRWLETLDGGQGVALRYVAHVPLAHPDAPALLAEQAAFPRVVGIRDILSWSPDPAQRFAAHGALMQDPVWRANLARLQDHHLVFDLMVFAHQLDEAARLAADFPDQLFVLNHGGSPIDRTPAGMAAWRQGLAALARNANVRIKVSDLVAYDHNRTTGSLAEVIHTCLDCFGPDRAMFASDFPVARLHATFDEVYEVFKVVTADLSVDEQRALFFETARQTYRLDGMPG